MKLIQIFTENCSMKCVSSADLSTGSDRLIRWRSNKKFKHSILRLFEIFFLIFGFR